MSVEKRAVRILIIDDFAPDLRLGSGVPRFVELLRALSLAGAHVTMFPTSKTLIDQSDGVQMSAHGANIIGEEKRELGRCLAATKGSFDAVIVSRPHNMATLRRLASRNRKIIDGVTLIYDAEALFSARDEVHSRIRGTPMSAQEAKRRTDEEVGLAQGTQLVLAVTESTAKIFVAAGHPNVRVLGHAISGRPTPQPFEARDGFLFVGPTYDDDTPNSDAVVWFVDQVLPLLKTALNRDVSLMLAGAVKSRVVRARVGAGIDALGVLSDLEESFSRARVFVAPIRYAAGIPFKVHHAAAYGVPAVVSPLLADLLGWTHENELLVAETPKDFAAACLRLNGDRELWERIRLGALQRIAEDCSTSYFDQTVADIVAYIAARRRRSGGIFRFRW
jgi:hypothetical protein